MLESEKTDAKWQQDIFQCIACIEQCIDVLDHEIGILEVSQHAEIEQQPDAEQYFLCDSIPFPHTHSHAVIDQNGGNYNREVRSIEKGIEIEGRQNQYSLGPLMEIQSIEAEISQQNNGQKNKYELKRIEKHIS